jgi:hypothetical protein
VDREVTVSRGDTLRVVGLAAGARILGSTGSRLHASEPADYPAIAAENGDSIGVSNTAPVVETRNGKVRRYVRKGIYLFKGIPR